MTQQAKEPFLCPACKTKLVRGAPQCYETLDEGIFGGAECPPRKTYVCPNKKCQVLGDCFWSYDGEGPYWLGPYKSERKVKWIDNNPLPFNTYHRACYFEIYYKNEDRHLKVGRFTLCREVRYKSNDHGDKVGKRVRYTLWTPSLWIPGYRMFFHCIRMLHVNKEYPDQLSREIRDTLERAKWPRAEWWRKAAALWVKIFYKKEVKGNDPTS